MEISDDNSDANMRDENPYAVKQKKFDRSSDVRLVPKNMY